MVLISDNIFSLLEQNCMRVISKSLDEEKGRGQTENYLFLLQFSQACG